MHPFASRIFGSFSFIIITQSKLSIPSHTLCIVWCEFDMCELFKIPYFNFKTQIMDVCSSFLLVVCVYSNFVYMGYYNVGYDNR